MPDFTDEMISSGFRLTRQHVGVGHARHRHMGIGLAPSVAGRLHAHQPGVQPVMHEADQNAVLDQRGVGGRRALVIDGQRAAAVGQGAVIHHGHAGGGDALADMRPANALVFLRLKSPSRPWPIASCSKMPGQPEPSTTSISPAGACDRIQIDDGLAAGLRRCRPSMCHRSKMSE